MTTRGDIKGWLVRGRKYGATHVIVVCDTFDHEDYPVFVAKNENVRKVMDNYDGKNMQRIMEVYDLSQNIEEQLGEKRAMRVR